MILFIIDCVKVGCDYQSIRRSTGSWAKSCEGKTESEMNDMGFITNDAWMIDDDKPDFKIGQKVKLNELGITVASVTGVKVWQSKHGSIKPITGTIAYIKDVIYGVKMDGDFFASATYGVGYNTFVDDCLEAI
jgi:hypothetical protein